MKYSFVILLLVALSFLGCEKDDICSADTPTTPSLIIRFYNIDDPNTDVLESVTNLKIQGVGNDEVLPGYDVVATDSIALPLKTTDTITQYSLYKEYVVDDNDSITGGNEDIITIRYNMTEVYVSRACGYKTIYGNVSINLVPDSDNWIKLIRSVDDNQSVDNDNEQQFKIYH